MSALIKGVKFLKNGVKDSKGQYCAVWYSPGLYHKPGNTLHNVKNITVYARNYGHLPKELEPQNESDGMTDYFETDKVIFFEGSKEYELLKELIIKNKIYGAGKFA